MTAAETQHLQDFVSAWAAAWESCSAARVLALWDKADRQSWYLPADSVAPNIGVEVIGVIQRRCIGLRAMRYAPTNMHLRVLGPDVGSAFFELDWSRSTSDVTVGSRLRVTMVMRKVEGAWHAFHYAEAPLAPLLELQAYYERVAAEGLDAMPQRMWPA